MAQTSSQRRWERITCMIHAPEIKKSWLSILFKIARSTTSLEIEEKQWNQGSHRASSLKQDSHTFFKKYIYAYHCANAVAIVIYSSCKYKSLVYFLFLVYYLLSHYLKK